MAQSIFTHRGFLDLAIQEIYRTYGHNVVADRKTLFKFGRGDSLGTSETEIMSLNQNETYVSDNLIDTISSSNAGDTQEVLVEGMTISGSTVTFTTQTSTLNGQNKVTLTTPLYRCTRLRNEGSTLLAGDVYVYQDTAISGGVPIDLTKVHNHMPAEDGASLKAGTTIASSNYFILTGFYAGINKKSASSADIRLKIRRLGKTYVTQVVTSIQSTNPPSFIPVAPYLIVPPGADIFLTAICSVSNVDVSAGFYGVFADIQN